jgi:hypothetical protein
VLAEIGRSLGGIPFEARLSHRLDVTAARGISGSGR